MADVDHLYPELDYKPDKTVFDFPKPPYLFNGKLLHEHEVNKIALKNRKSAVVFDINGKTYTPSDVIRHAVMVERVRWIECSLLWNGVFYFMFLYAVLQSGPIMALLWFIDYPIAIVVYLLWKHYTHYNRYLGEKNFKIEEKSDSGDE